MNEFSMKLLAVDYLDKLINQGDLSVCDELLSENYIDHDMSSEIQDYIEETKKYIYNLFQHYLDMNIIIHDSVAEGDKVVLRSNWYGTNIDTGENCSKMDIVILRFDAKGQIAEKWSASKEL